MSTETKKQRKKKHLLRIKTWDSNTSIPYTSILELSYGLSSKPVKKKNSKIEKHEK